MCEKEQDKYLIGIASVYNKTYYYNPRYKELPAAVKNEIQEICTEYAGKLHCAFSVKFKGDGGVCFETAVKDDDCEFSEEAADLTINELVRNKRDFLISLKLWYKVFVLGLDTTDIS